MLANDVTLEGGEQRNTDLFPPADRFGALFVDHPQVLNVLHYCRRDSRGIWERVADILRLAGPHLAAIQVNISWPKPEHIACLSEELARAGREDLGLIVQVGREAQNFRNGDPGAIASRAARYQGFADALLLDTSSGRGIEPDPELWTSLLRSVAETCPGMGLGIAGGIGPDNIGFLRNLLDEFPKLSIDAQKKLRGPDDRLCPQIAALYVKRAFALVDGSS